ncbi:MAG: ABC transporter permease [Coprococcus sp.]
MKKVRYYLRIYFRLASQYLKERMQFRADFVCDIIGMFIVNFCGIATFWVIFQNITEVGGFNFNEMLFMYGFSLMAMSPQQLLLDNAWVLSDRVVTGDFIKYCFRPVNVLFYFMSERVDVKGFSQFGIGLVLLVIAWHRLSLPITILNMFMFVVLWIGAVFICMALIIVSSTFGFMGGGTNAAVFLASDLKSYGRYPLTIFNKLLKFLFTFILPIGFIAYYPAGFFFGKQQGVTAILTYLSPVIGVCFFLVSCKIWEYFAERYAGTGS